MEIKGASLAAAMVGMSPAITLLLEWRLFQRVFSTVELAGMAIVIAGGIALAFPHLQGDIPVALCYERIH